MSLIRSRLAQCDTSQVRERVLLVLAHERARRRSTSSPATLPQPLSAGSARADQVRKYSDLVPRVRAAIESAVPADSHVLVVSRGDDALLELQALVAGHFPQVDGKWAGFYPRSGEDAVTHLDELTTAGWEFIVFPATAFWWFDYYEKLAGRLLARGRTICHDADCAIFELAGDRSEWP
jgi:hypothetical protein